MLIMTALTYMQLNKIDALSNTIVKEDMVKADAANTINALTRSNGRNIAELMITPDKTQRDAIYQRIADNRSIISDAIATLEKLIRLPKGKELLATVVAQRNQYVDSFTQIKQLMEAEKRDEAIQLVKTKTFPTLDKLQNSLSSLANFQGELVINKATEVNDRLSSARFSLIIFCTCALLVGACIIFFITQTLVKQLGGEPNYATGIASKIASGDLAVFVEVKPSDKTSLLAALKSMRDSLAHIVEQVRTGTTAVASASNQIAAGNLDLSSRTEQQASTLEEIASSMEELTSTAKQNADNAQQANRLAQSASKVAEKGGDVVAQVVSTMGSINESSQKIAEIISVIDSIAFQTNILALNAAVEAARAGEQGRGFAVVASEVRNLAQRSASASKEIKELIANSVEKVNLGSQLVGQAGVTMNEIVTSVQRVTDIMSEITTASHEQTAGIQQINLAVTQIDDATQHNAALVEEATAASQSLHQQAENLAEIVSVFKL
jgi:methyl-accepting chemotaxis protein